MTSPRALRAGLRVGNLVVGGREAGGFRVRCDCGAVEVRSANSIRGSRRRGIGRCAGCIAGRRAFCTKPGLSMAQRGLMATWERDGTLYVEQAVEDMCHDVHEGLVAAFGLPRDREPLVDELQWGRREVAS